MERGDLELMRLQAATLYRLDDEGRLTAINEPGLPAAPRLFLGRTTAGNVRHLRHDLPEPLAAELEALLRAEPVVDDLEREPVGLETMRVAIERHPPIGRVWRGPAFLIPEHVDSIGGAVEVTGAYAAALVGTFSWLTSALAAFAPCYAVVEGGVAVSICFSSRSGVAAAEAGVETLPAYRGRGHASAAVAAWAAAIRRSGRLPLYSTAWENLGSRGVARRLGMKLYGEDISLG